MEDQYLRKKRRRHILREIARVLFKTKRRTLIVLLFSVILSYVTFNSHGIIQRIRLEMQKKTLEQKIQGAEAENKRLQEESKALEGDSTSGIAGKQMIEKVAREKYGMVREGETVYKVKKK